MSDLSFRSVEFWKSAMMTMPDNSFFELLRSVFGKIKTPFTKQQLVKDLETFLLRDDIQKNIAGYIDETDAVVIAAAAVLGDPAAGEMESFFSGELNYAELHDIIINLEERFILYRFQEDGAYRLSLNPVLRVVLEPAVLERFASDSSPLFPSMPADASGASEKMASNVIPDDRIFAGLLAFTVENPSFFKAEGEIRKRVADAAETAFPGLETGPLIGGMRVLGLLNAKGDEMLPDFGRFSAFAGLKPRERLEYFCAGIYCYWNLKVSSEISPHLLRGHIRSLAGFIHQFMDSLEAERLYPLKTLKRLTGILERKSGGVVSVNGFQTENINGGLMMQALEKAGLLAASGKYWRIPTVSANTVKHASGGKTGSKANGKAASKAADRTDAAETPFIVMDSSFSCFVYPEINCGDVFSLAGILNVREAGPTVRFEMTRDSVVRAFDRGIMADEIIALLKRLAADRIDEALIWTIKDWEKRYTEVAMNRGLVLSLSPERRYLAETKALARLISATLAPGVYLLDEAAENEAALALRHAGVDIIARHSVKGGNSRPVRTFQPGNAFFPDLSAKIEKDTPLSKESGKRAERAGSRKKKDGGGTVSASTLIADFHTILERMRLPEAERDELAARINRRLIVSESQLKDASVRYEKLEARGLDYVGKMNIARQAIAMRLPVEIVLPPSMLSVPGKDRIFGIPKALEKDKNESVLVVEPDGGGVMRIPLGKISLLRRVKKSIFETNTV